MTTRSKARQAAREARNRVPLNEETVISEGSTPVQFGTISSINEESALTSIAETSGEGGIITEGEAFTTHIAPSEQETIRAPSEEPQEPEQSYTTAPGSFGFSANPTGFSTPAASAPRGQEKEELSHEEWGQLRESMRRLSLLTIQDKEESIENRRDINRFDEELKNLRTRVTNSYHRTTNVEEVLQGVQSMFDRLNARREDTNDQPHTPRTEAVQSVFADRRPDEGTPQYERRRRAQIRFEAPQFSGQQGIEEDANDNPGRKMTPAERCRAQIAESRMRAAWKRPRARSYGPPVQTSRRCETTSDSDGGEDPEYQPREAVEPETKEPRYNYYIDSGPREPVQPQYNYRTNVGSHAQPNYRTARNEGTNDISARPSVHASSVRNAMDYDYARCLMSAQPQQLAGPYMPPAPILGQRLSVRSVTTQGLDDSDHEAHMIDNLIEHIRESLTGIPDNLPEIKGLRAKMPEPYEGEDDYDRLDKWLQGLLRFFKLHRLTGMEKDRDRILVAGTNLRGKAERWYSHEVERPTRLVRNWTFESVVIGLFRAFITTATAQQAMQRYMRIRFSPDEGVMAFY